ncbi:hypothetical protein [Nocardia sp. NPDC004860]|uniref:hypothetical protein n=1 Tax=Nocardia sp. NPDC004860 TaxID=3154557 RepID=UPI0033A537D0
MRLERIGRTTAVRELERSLALKPELDIVERRYEMLRAVAWASTHAQTPVYVRVLLDRAVTVDKSLNLGDAGLSESDRRQILREQLEDLASIGDLAELGNGYWVSVDGVIVELGSDQSCLFVSGIPLRILDQETRDAIMYSGAARHLAKGSVLGKLELPIVGLQLWARRLSTDLETWTRQFGEAIRIAAGTPDDSLEFYLPETARRGCLQHDRWQRTASNLTGTYLYRQTVLNHWRLHGLARLNAGVVEGTCEIDRQDAHRLMFGYDMLGGNPTTATWNESASSSAELILHNPVPAPEMRALTALAKRLPAKKFEHRFIATTYRQQVRQTVEDLGIRLVRGSDG